jgi:hypothetical protein
MNDQHTSPQPQPQTITYVVASNSFPKPPVYQGERDGFLCEAWLTAMRRYFIGADIPDIKRTLTAVSYMAAAAALWWEGQALDDLCPWEEFAAAFRSEFSPAGFLDQVRSMLFTIKMTSTVSDYVARTRKYLALLSAGVIHEQARAMLEESAKACFLNGAPLALQQQLLNFQINSPLVSPSMPYVTLLSVLMEFSATNQTRARQTPPLLLTNLTTPTTLTCSPRPIMTLWRWSSTTLLLLSTLSPIVSTQATGTTGKAIGPPIMAIDFLL